MLTQIRHKSRPNRAGPKMGVNESSEHKNKMNVSLNSAPLGSLEVISKDAQHTDICKI